MVGLSDCGAADACVTVQVYGEYKASLAFDLVSSRQKNVSQTHTVYPTMVLQ